MANQDINEQDADASVTGEMTNAESVAHGAKKVIGTTAKGTAIGMIAGGAAGGAFALATAATGCAALGAATFGLGLIGCAVAASFWGTAAAVSALTTGALWGGGFGGAIGVVLGLSGVDDSIEAENGRRIASAEQKLARKESVQALQARRGQVRTAMRDQDEELGLSSTPMRGRARVGQEQMEGI